MYTGIPLYIEWSFELKNDEHTSFFWGTPFLDQHISDSFPEFLG